MSIWRGVSAVRQIGRERLSGLKIPAGDTSIRLRFDRARREEQAEHREAACNGGEPTSFRAESAENEPR